jgi:diguanylate cyclase (GGDEF)-like protein/PAS domain S-box-containing protein
MTRSRILLVDDMPSIHEDFRKILVPTPSASALDTLELALFDTGPTEQANDFDLVSAYQGQEALQALKTARLAGQPFALAFVDMRMPPGWDGAETIERLWQEDPCLQVVICTAYSDCDWSTLLNRLDARDRLLILKKPFEAIEVSRMAHALTAKWQGAREVARHTAILEAEVQARTLDLQTTNARLRDELEERQRAQAELTLAASVFGNAMDGIVVTDEHSRILTVNPAFTHLTGYSADEAVGRKLSMLRSEHADPDYHRNEWQTLLRDGRWAGELWSRRKDGALFCERLHLSEVQALSGQPRRFVGVFNDITELRRKDDRIRHMAFHDALTNLPNRALLLERLERAIAQASRQNLHLGLMFIDLDRFKQINDSLGHDVGDEFLKEVARRLGTVLRQSDTAARMGGDEFVLLVEGVAQPTDLTPLAERLMDTLSAPVLLGPHTLPSGASLGIACFPQDGTTVSDLIKSADAAMYAAKSAGRCRYCHYQATLPSVSWDPAI